MFKKYIWCNQCLVFMKYVAGFVFFFEKWGKSEVVFTKNWKCVWKKTIDPIYWIEENVVALSFVLRSGTHVISLVGTTNVTRLEQLSTACDYLDKWTDDLWYTVASDAGIDCDGWFSKCYELPPLGILAKRFIFQKIDQVF